MKGREDDRSGKGQEKSRWCSSKGVCVCVCV